MKEKENEVKVIVETTKPASRVEFNFNTKDLRKKEVFQKMNEHFDFLKSIKLK